MELSLAWVRKQTSTPRAACHARVVTPVLMSIGESKAVGHDLPAASNTIFRIGHVTTIHYGKPTRVVH